MNYEKGHVKRNSETGEVAVRTMFPSGENPQQQLMEWWCVGSNSGPRTTWTLEVDGWDDLYTPPPVEEAPAPPVEEPIPVGE